MGSSIADTDLDDDSDFAEAHEINVTPFIDVILVLLIIFMVAAPLSTVDLPIDLPTSSATPQKKPDKPTYVTIKPDLTLAIGQDSVKRVDLVHSLDAMADTSKDRIIFLRADRSVPYGELMGVLEILRAGGYTKIKLVALEAVPAALALTHLRSDDGDDGLGANGIEVALEMASPKVPDDDLPPGPDVDAQQATPPVPEQKAEVKETDLPKD